MRFQKYEHYALLFMSELAQPTRVGPLSVASVSKDHGVSLPFLKKIVRSLRTAGLVCSKEGVGGGYTLARKPQSISLWEIISAMSAQEPVPTACPFNTSCLPQHIRARLTNSIKEQLERISLKEATR